VDVVGRVRGARAAVGAAVRVTVRVAVRVTVLRAVTGGAVTVLGAAVVVTVLVTALAPVGPPGSSRGAAWEELAEPPAAADPRPSATTATSGYMIL
jgi:hypothetical protein